ncbi:MAG: 50S ribosomal protein L17 [Desulfocapsaceae bacterium]|nr:50S ribosomal protein L17 [Desulfocapsaceae bacterium]
MRHRKSGRKLGRTGSHREAMFRNMVTSLFEHERIVTTTEKAKEMRPIAEKMITLAKRGDLHARRQAYSYIRSQEVVAKLFDEISEMFADRNGGYTRIIKTGVRQGDAASMAILELVGYEEDLGEEEVSEESEE